MDLRRWWIPLSGALLAVALAAPPLPAAEVVIPIASSKMVDGLTYTTRVWVANPGDTAQTFTASFYAAGADGTATPPASSPQTAPPGRTLVYAAVAGGDGTTGMVAVQSSAPLLVTARLETRSGQQLLGAVDVPTLTAATAFAAGATAGLSGLERGGGAATSDLYLFNLDGAAAQCTVKVVRADGNVILGAAELGLAPRQRRDFSDVLGTLGGGAVSDVRVEARCDRRFWAAALVRRPNAAATLLVPSTAIAGDALGDPSPPPPTDGSVVFSVPGLFLDAKANAAYRAYELPATGGKTYASAVVEFDLRIGKFADANFTGVHAFRRPHPEKREQVLFYGLQINNYKARTILDLGLTEELAKGTVPWVAGHTYHLKFTYDVPAKRITLEVFENGVRKQNVSGDAHHFDLRNDGHPLVVDFGMVGVGGDGGYVPPIGWRYSDLKVVLRP